MELLHERAVTLPVVLHAGLRRHRRIERALVDLDLQRRHVDAEHRRGDVGILSRPCRDRAVERSSARSDRPARPATSLPGSTPITLPIGGARRRQVRLCGQHLRAAGGEPRFGLRHVGLRHLADVEAIARLPQLLLQHLDVAPLQIEHRGVAQHVHVGGGGVQQHGLLDQPQRLARGRNLALRLPRAVGGLEAVEQRLRRRHADANAA